MYFPQYARGRGGIYGLAVDIGTTTLVLQVVDLEKGENVGQAMTSKNPQIAYGNEVISRIGYTIDHAGGLEELQGPVVVGNSTMRDLAFGREVRSLGLIPFEAGDLLALMTSASDIGLGVHPKAIVYGPPLIGGHAGSDCLADIIATNGEVVIGNRDRMLTASCAAGGAYEGYQIRCGVGAIEGAITSFKIENGRPRYQTLGGKHAVGVCGSGVIDLLAELLRTDQDLLIRYYGIAQEEVQRVYLAGAFGNFMDVENALAGARAMLCSKRKRADAENLKGMLTHLKPNEIEGGQFQYLVAENIYFE